MIRRTATAALMYALAACAFTWPLVLHPHSLFGAMDPTGDPSLYLWTLGWDLHTLASHPAWLLTGRVFNAGIFFPAPLTLAYSDHLLLQAVALWPVYAVTHDLIFCYNVLLIGSLVAAALAMHVLARALTGSEAAASVAGLIFGFAPYHFTHLLHVQLQALYFLPLSFFFLHRLFAAERRSDTIALGVVTALQTISSVYYGVIGTIGLACATVVLMAATGRITDWRLLRRGVAAAALALLVAAPWSIPYLRVARDAGGGRTLYEASNGSAVLSSYLQAPATNLVYGRTGWLRPGARAPLPFKDGPEQALFLGFVAMLLAAAGALAAPQGLKRIAAVYAVLAVVGFVLSLGPNGIRAVYAALYGALLGMAAIRASARFSVLTLLGVAMLAALAVRALELRRPRIGRFAGAAAFGLIARGILQRRHRVPGAAGADHRGRTLAPRAAGIRRGRLRADGPVRRQHPVHAPVARARTRDRERLQRLSTAVLRGAPRRGQPPPRASGARDPPRSRRRVRRQRRPSGDRSGEPRRARGARQLRRPAHLSGRVVAGDRRDVHGDHGRGAARSRSAAVRRRRIGDVPRSLDERPDERARRAPPRLPSCLRRAARATGFRCWRRRNPGCRASTKPMS